ncbi:TPA: phage neck terminator protein [Enterobacter cloacae]|nr:hypothetical protein [Enterobacter cloacae]EKV5783717.1 hypothetical protein [Enterobacter cloacae]HCR1965775.1 hypothetical protein [Enterobacter kobei]
MAETTVSNFVPDAVESAAYRVLSQLLPVPLAYANQNNSRIPLPYATLRVSTRTTIGRDEHGEVDDEGVMPSHGVREGTVMVNVYGGSAREHCDDLINNIRKTTSRYLMRREKFVIANSDQVNDLTALRDEANFEAMANVDLTFRYTGKYTDNVGLIETVDATGDIGGIETHLTIAVTSD